MIGKQYLKDLAKNTPIRFFTGKDEKQEQNNESDEIISLTKKQYDNIISSLENIEIKIKKLEKNQKQLSKLIKSKEIVEDIQEKSENDDVDETNDTSNSIVEEEIIIKDNVEKDDINSKEYDDNTKDLIINYYKNGLSYARIAQELNKNAYLNQEGNKWHWTQTKKLILSLNL